MRANPLNYDSWFDYLRLEEDAGDIERAREASRGAVGEAARWALGAQAHSMQGAVWERRGA